MSTPDYILDLRRSIGHDLLFLPGVSAVVVRNQGDRPETLLVRRVDTGLWTLPSGIVEPGEQPAVSMLRELWEETRVEAVVERLALVSTLPEQIYPNGDRCQFISMTFRCRFCRGEAVVGDEESTAVGWFSPSELPTGLDHRHRRRIAAGLMSGGPCEFDL